MIDTLPDESKNTNLPEDAFDIPDDALKYAEQYIDKLKEQ